MGRSNRISPDNYQTLAVEEAWKADKEKSAQVAETSAAPAEKINYLVFNQILAEVLAAELRPMPSLLLNRKIQERLFSIAQTLNIYQLVDEEGNLVFAGLTDLFDNAEVLKHLTHEDLLALRKAVKNCQSR